MAPEQWSANGQVDSRTDVYGFGIILYEMLTGETPFKRRENEPPYILYRKHVAEPVPNPKSRNPQISDDMSSVILRCLRKKPEERYSSFAEVITDISGAYKRAFGEPWVPKIFAPPPQKKSSRATQLAVRGASLQCIDDHRAAISVLDKALALDPYHSLALRLKGRSCCAMNKHAEAFGYFEQLATRSADDAQNQDDMAFCLNELGHSVEALRHAERSIQLDPMCSSSRNNRGIALANLGRFDEAEQSFDEAIRLNAQSAEAWNNKGFLFVKTGKTEQAIACFRRAIDLNPRYITPYFNLKALELQRGLKSKEPGAMAASMRKACTLMEAVLAVEPTHPGALKILLVLRQGLADEGYTDR
jgi:Flp pilus assembly protein TadD